jgi:hypothetical protein
MCDWKAVRDAKAAQDVLPVRSAGLSKLEEETHQNVDYAGYTYAGEQHGKRTFGGQDPFELSRADEKEREKNRPKGKRCWVPPWRPDRRAEACAPEHGRWFNRYVPAVPSQVQLTSIFRQLP